MGIAFVDQAKIFVKAGDGGRGCSSLYRDKYMRYAKPDGGDGGRGADIVLLADRNIYTLLDFHITAIFAQSTEAMLQVIIRGVEMASL